MSWKLNTLAVALCSMLALKSAAHAQDVIGNDAGLQDHYPAVSTGDTRLLATPSKADKDLIEKQKTCPVTDRKLGAMGQPVKVVAKGHTVFLCCAGCKKKFMANTDKYLKRLDEQKKTDEQK